MPWQDAAALLLLLSGHKCTYIHRSCGRDFKAVFIVHDAPVRTHPIYV